MAYMYRQPSQQAQQVVAGKKATIRDKPEAQATIQLQRVPCLDWVAYSMG